MAPNSVDVVASTYDARQEPGLSNENEDVTKISVENGNIPRIAPDQRLPHNSNKEKLRTFTATMNSLAHILIGAVTVTTLIFAFRNGLPITATPIHIVLCVIGYQLLMAEGILSLSSSNGWSSHLRLVNKRRAHFILQIMGSALAIAGSFIKILDKDEHWTTLHGRFALVALVFTTVSLVNGVASLWAYELRGILPGTVSKLAHVCFGTVAYSAAGITLCFGYDKGLFRNWISDAVSYTAIALTATLMSIVILTPAVTLKQKCVSLVRR